MRALPDLDDAKGMAQWGRRSALMSAWKEAKESLRDASTHSQGCDIEEADKFVVDVRAAADRLVEIANLWRIVQ